MVGRTVQPPNGRQNKTYSSYIRARLFHAEKDLDWRSKTVKTRDVPGEGGDIMWNERFEWEYDADELAFLRCAPYLSALSLEPH